MDSSISRERLREIRDTWTLFLQPPNPKTTLTDFHLFPQLPFDLRVLIWNLVSKVPRVVVVDVFAKTGDEFERGAKRCVTPTPVPSVLHVCTESRDIALRPGKYELVFAWREPSNGDDSSDEESLDTPQSIYFNFAVDTLYFRCLHNLPSVSHRTALSRLAIVRFGNHIRLSQIQRIRSVAMDVGAKNAEIAVEHLLQKTRGGKWSALRSVALVLDERNGALIMRGCVEFLQLKKYPAIYTRIFPFTSVPWGKELIGKVKARERGEFIGFRELRKLMKRRCQDQEVVMKAIADCQIEEVVVVHEDQEQ